MGATDSKFLTPKEAAARAGLSPTAVYGAIRRGELRAVRLCSRLRIPPVAFEEWVERSTVEPEQPVVEVRRVPPMPRGSFRRLLDGSDGGRDS